MAKKTALITGANRGIGLGLTRQFLSAGYKVIATSRNPDGARELWELEHEYKSLRLIELDVTSDAQIKNLKEELFGETVDILVNNAGISIEGSKPFADISMDSVLKSFNTNTLGPMRVTQALLPNLKKSSRPIVATITSKMGSIADNTSGGYYGYRASKTAVNMVNKSLSVDMPGMIAVVLHPGWVETEMGGPNAPTSVSESVEGLFAVLSNLKPQDTGKFFDYRGQPIPW